MKADIFWKQILDEYSTPSFVFDENELTERAGKIREILGDISFCYSIKANPFLINALLPLVDYFEVCSPGELAICKALKVPPQKIIYSGVHKERADIEEAVRYGAAILTAESVRHYDIICETAKELDSKTDVILRLTSKTQFGMSIEDIESILSKPSPFVDIKGLHYFAGTGRKQLKKHQDELSMLTETMERLRKTYDMDLPMLEYGPGLPHPYFSDEDFTDTFAPLKALKDDLMKTAEKCTLSVEMGRFLASSCGYYLTSVCDIKRSADTNWVIVDGGINHVNYLGQMMGMKVPLIKHYRDGKYIDDNEGEAYTVCGSLCTTNDILIRSIPFNDLKVGDVLIFANIGAYSVTEAMGLFLSRTLPRIIKYRDGKTELQRDHLETWPINSHALDDEPERLDK